MTSFSRMWFVLSYHFRAIPIGWEHWLGDTFSWYRKSKGGTWCYWNGFWAQADPQTNFVRYQRGVAGYNPVEKKWKWDCDKSYRVGDILIDEIERYDPLTGTQP